MTIETAPTSNNTCDRCGATDEGIGWFARAYRKVQLKHGRGDPGNLCGKCAGKDVGPRQRGSQPYDH